MPVRERRHVEPVGSDAEPARGQSAACVQLKSSLSGLPVQEQMAMLRPPVPLGLGAPATAAPVQMEDTPDTRPMISTLNKANLAKVVSALKKAGVWANLLAKVKAVIGDGTGTLDASAEDDILIDALIVVEEQFQFGGGASLDAMLTDATTRSSIVGALKEEAMPQPVVIPAAGTFGMVTKDAELVLADGSK